jgi:hypothetical protein
LYTVFSDPTILVKNLAKNLTKHLAKNLTKNLAKKHRQKSGQQIMNKSLNSLFVDPGVYDFQCYFLIQSPIVVLW